MALLMAVALLGAGCGGFNTTQNVSPATFFLPGILQANPPATNGLPVVAVENFTELVSIH